MNIMEWINRTRTIKMILIVIAILLGVASLVFSNYLVRDLEREEAIRMEIWTEAMRTFNNADENTDLNLVLTVIRGNNTIPVIVLDDKGYVGLPHARGGCHARGCQHYPYGYQ